MNEARIITSRLGTHWDCDDTPHTKEPEPVWGYRPGLSIGELRLLRRRRRDGALLTRALARRIRGRLGAARALRSGHVEISFR